MKDVSIFVSLVIVTFIISAQVFPTNQKLGLLVFAVGTLASIFIPVLLKTPTNNLRPKNIRAAEDRYEKLKSKLEEADSYKYIENFVAKLTNLSATGSAAKLGIEMQVEAPDFFNLKEFLSNKNFSFTDEDLKLLLEWEGRMQAYKAFVEKMSSRQLWTLNEYIQGFFEIYGDNYKSYLVCLKLLLQERKVIFDEKKIESEIEKLKRILELKQFEKKLNNTKRTPTVAELDLLAGSEFEEFLKVLFEKMGYTVKNIQASRDFGADLLISKLGEAIVVQAKRYSAKVSNDAVQEAAAAIKYYNADKGMVVTTSEFTKAAVILANSNKIELVDRHQLGQLMTKYF